MCVFFCVCVCVCVCVYICVCVCLGTKAKGDEVLVTWDNPEQLEAYIRKLQAAADRLTTENRKLRKSHNIVSEKVVCCTGRGGQRAVSYTHLTLPTRRTV